MMDSFYEQPRSVPVPIHIEKTVSSPHVPDVSLIFQNRTQSKPANFNDCYQSYNVWKARKEQSRCGGGYEHNKENVGDFTANMQSPFRKQVRFTGPLLQQNTPSSSIKQGGFEQIYIANIPNRHLDLSLVEPPKPKQNNPLQIKAEALQIKAEGPRIQSKFYDQQKSKANELNTQKFRRNDNDTSVVKQMNSRLPSLVANSNQEIPGGYERSGFASMRQSNLFPSTGYESFEVPLSKQEKQPATDNSEPSVKDLLKIIQQQNEQMILLQKQVASLLENKSSQKQIEDAPVASPQFEPGTIFGKKLAIDVMTSFEVSIRQNFPHRGMFLKDFNCEPKIQEITESDELKSENVLDGIRSETKQSTSIDDTFVLGESLKIQEESPSPEHSIHVDMQDYSSDSDSESADIGWTIYNNVMGQVNNILKKTNSQSNELNSTGKTKDKTTQRVKQATLQHLKSLGVSLPTDLDSNISKSSTSEYTPSEISFAVKQLLMKYLPDDQLAKIMQQPNNNQAKKCDEAIKFAKRRPEFSFATLQYMKKYNLLNVNADPPESHSPLTKAASQQDRENPKMLLDVTALKQQPKLL